MTKLAKKAKVTQEDEIKALEDLWKIYGEDITEFSTTSAARAIDPNIKRFLDGDPPISKLNRAHIALLTAIHARRRRDKR